MLVLKKIIVFILTAGFFTIFLHLGAAFVTWIRCAERGIALGCPPEVETPFLFAIILIYVAWVFSFTITNKYRIYFFTGVIVSQIIFISEMITYRNTKFSLHSISLGRWYLAMLLAWISVWLIEFYRNKRSNTR